MYKNKKIIAVITARKGSSRIKNKNLIKLHKRKLIEWTFDASLNSKFIDKTIISSNDDKILKLANNYKIASLYKRPEKLSNSKIGTNDVLKHLLDWMTKNQYEEFDYIVLLQPTSPLRKSADVDEAIKKIIGSKLDTLVSVGETPFPGEWIINNIKHKKFVDLNKFKSAKRSQEYGDSYFLNGSIFISKIRFFKKNKTFFSKKTCLFKMPLKKSIDIDDLEDLKIAEYFIKENKT